MLRLLLVTPEVLLFEIVNHSSYLAQSHVPNAGRGACGSIARCLFGNDGSHEGRRFRDGNDEAS